jgi:hypothetical protein
MTGQNPVKWRREMAAGTDAAKESSVKNRSTVEAPSKALRVK